LILFYVTHGYYSNVLKSKDIGNIKLKFKQYSIETLSLAFVIINLKYSKFVLLKVGRGVITEWESE